MFLPSPSDSRGLVRSISRKRLHTVTGDTPSRSASADRDCHPERRRMRSSSRRSDGVRRGLSARLVLLPLLPLLAFVAGFGRVRWVAMTGA
jgi:hypothetical protein